MLQFSRVQSDIMVWRSCNHTAHTFLDWSHIQTQLFVAIVTNSAVLWQVPWNFQVIVQINQWRCWRRMSLLQPLVNWWTMRPAFNRDRIKVLNQHICCISVHWWYYMHLLQTDWQHGGCFRNTLWRTPHSQVLQQECCLSAVEKILDMQFMLTVLTVLLCRGFWEVCAFLWEWLRRRVGIWSGKTANLDFAVLAGWRRIQCKRDKHASAAWPAIMIRTLPWHQQQAGGRRPAECRGDVCTRQRVKAKTVAHLAWCQAKCAGRWRTWLDVSMMTLRLEFIVPARIINQYAQYFKTTALQTVKLAIPGKTTTRDF